LCGESERWFDREKTTLQKRRWMKHTLLQKKKIYYSAITGECAKKKKKKQKSSCSRNSQ